ncbi:MAG: hypothetical protein E7363_01665 [Clostridiales bacterium]|nr:hypothetical protein [Clostridiales bacterium]
MKDLLQKKGLYVLIYVVLAVFMEMITFISMKLGVAPKYFLLDLSIIFLFATIIFVIPSFTAESILIVFLLLLQFILSFLNYTLNTIQVGSVFKLEMLGLANEAAGAFTSEFMDWGFFFLLLAIPAVAVALLIFLKKYRVPYNGAHNLIFIMVFTFACTCLGSSAMYNLTVKNLYNPTEMEDPLLYRLTSDKYLYDHFTSLQERAFPKFGTFAFYYMSLDRILSAKLSSGNMDAEETEMAQDELANYFVTQPTSTASSYSGILKGQNIITIMVESGEWYGIDPNFTPTLYALMNQGYKNEKYYSRDKTNHSEAIAILGSYPVETPFTSNYTSNDTLLGNTLSFTLPSILKADGYTTSFLHSNWGSYYGREDTHGVYGFENFYALEDMDLDSSENKKKDFYNFELDSELFGKNLDKIAPTDGNPFYTFITTLITHGHYEELIAYGDYANYLTDEQKAERAEKYMVKGLEPYYEQITQAYFKTKFKEQLAVNGLLDENGKVVSGRDADIYTRYLRYKRYQAGMMDLDRGVALLLDHLKENGLLENTTILMYGDHNAYYNDQQYYMKGIPKGQYEVPESYRVLFGMYSGKSPLHIPATGFTHAGDETFPLTRLTNTTRCTTTFDIVPTTLDLLGYTFNRGLYMGSSMFSHTPDITFISREGGMLSDKYFSLDGDEILYGDTGNAKAVYEFKLGAANYLAKQEKFEMLYKYDFFASSDVSKLVYKRK